MIYCSNTITKFWCINRFTPKHAISHYGNQLCSTIPKKLHFFPCIYTRNIYRFYKIPHDSSFWTRNSKNWHQLNISAFVAFCAMDIRRYTLWLRKQKAMALPRKISQKRDKVPRPYGSLFQNRDNRLQTLHCHCFPHTYKRLNQSPADSNTDGLWHKSFSQTSKIRLNLIVSYYFWSTNNMHKTLPKF